MTTLPILELQKREAAGELYRSSMTQQERLAFVREYGSANFELLPL